MIERLGAGTRVEVRSRFDMTFSRGFEVVEATDEGYRVRRLSDGVELPVLFDEEDVRPERKKQGLWWYS